MGEGYRRAQATTGETPRGFELRNEVQAESRGAGIACPYAGLAHSGYSLSKL